MLRFALSWIDGSVRHTWFTAVVFWLGGRDSLHTFSSMFNVNILRFNLPLSCSKVMIGNFMEGRDKIENFNIARDLDEVHCMPQLSVSRKGMSRYGAQHRPINTSSHTWQVENRFPFIPVATIADTFRDRAMLYPWFWWIVHAPCGIGARMFTPRTPIICPTD